MAFSQDEIILAFINYTTAARQGRTVGFSKRSGPGGAYVNVFGPSHPRSDPRNSRVAVDPSGAIGVKDPAVANALGGVRRSVGAVYAGPGGARWSLSRQQCMNTYTTEGQLVAAIITAMNAHGTW